MPDPEVLYSMNLVIYHTVNEPWDGKGGKHFF